jgi:hypothetical protein
MKILLQSLLLNHLKNFVILQYSESKGMIK